MKQRSYTPIFIVLCGLVVLLLLGNHDSERRGEQGWMSQRVVDLRNWNSSANAGRRRRAWSVTTGTSVSTFSLAVVTIASRMQSSGRSKSLKGWLCGIPLLAQDARRGAPIIADPERSSILGGGDLPKAGGRNSLWGRGFCRVVRDPSTTRDGSRGSPSRSARDDRVGVGDESHVSQMTRDMGTRQLCILLAIW